MRRGEGSGGGGGGGGEGGAPKAVGGEGGATEAGGGGGGERRTKKPNTDEKDKTETETDQGEEDGKPPNKHHQNSDHQVPPTSYSYPLSPIERTSTTAAIELSPTKEPATNHPNLQPSLQPKPTQCQRAHHQN